MSKNITITDVAKLAGVSKGTVDRVVHNRGEVSEKSAQKVRKAIQTLSYKPNLHATLLATKNERTIACLIPFNKEGEFWQRIHGHILAEENNLASLNLRLEFFRYDMNSLESFTETSGKLLESLPDGVIIAPLFMDAVKEVSNALVQRHIPFLYIDTNVEDDSHSLGYLGMPKLKSGYLCASLLTANCRKEDVDKVALIRVRRDSTGLSDPTAKRREGFVEYMTENFPDCEISNVFISADDPEETEKTLTDFFTGSGIRFIAMLSSRIHLISGFLDKYKIEGRRVIGFDALQSNLEMLAKGQADTIISQHLERFAKKAVEMMSDYLVMDKKPEDREIHMHMDILTALNLDSY